MRERSGQATGQALPIRNSHAFFFSCKVNEFYELDDAISSIDHMVCDQSVWLIVAMTVSTFTVRALSIEVTNQEAKNQDG